MRVRPFAVALAIVTVGCGVVLGIDGDIIDPTPDAATNAPPTITAARPSVSLRQGGSATLDVTAKPGSGRLVQVTLKGLPPGIASQPFPVNEGETKTITLTADDLTPRGDYHATLEGTTGDLAAAPIALDVHVDGNLDTTFGDAGVVVVPFGPTLANADGEPIGLAIDAQGRILVAYGIGDPGPSVPRPLAVVRLDAEGKLDSTFGDAGWALANIDGGNTPNQRAQALVLMPDGTIVVAGKSFEQAGKTEGVIALFDPNGALLAGEKVDAAATSTVYSSIAVESQQTVLALAQADTYGVLTRVSVLDGTIDPAYGDAGIATVQAKDKRTTTCHDVDIVGDRTLVSCRTQQNTFTVIALLPDAGLDTSFGTAGASPSPGVAGTVQEPFASVIADDRIVQVGGASTSALPDRIQVRVLSVLGVQDPTFGDGGIATYEPQREGTTGAEAFATLAVDGGLVIGGALEVGSGDRRALVFRIDLDAGLPDKSFAADGVSSPTWPDNVIAIRRLASQGDRVIAAALARRLVGSTPTVDVVLFRYLP